MLELATFNAQTSNSQDGFKVCWEKDIDINIFSAHSIRERPLGYSKKKEYSSF